MNKTHVVKKCIHVCPLFKADMDGMACGHPFWYGKGYDNMFIHHHQKAIPELCPLKKEPFEIKYTL